MKKISALLSIILFSAWLFTSCDKDNFEGIIISDEVFINNLHSNSSDTIIVDNQSLILETFVYRDFMPGGPIKQSTRLTASVNLVNIDSVLVTQNFSVAKLYLINEKQVWSSDPKFDIESYIPNFKRRLYSTNGPEWETGILIDVVISIIDKSNNIEKFLIARNQIIERTD